MNFGAIYERKLAYPIDMMNFALNFLKSFLICESIDLFVFLRANAN